MSSSDAAAPLTGNPVIDRCRLSRHGLNAEWQQLNGEANNGAH